MIRHRIMWQSRRTGLVGCGDWLDLSKEETERLAAAKDAEHLGFFHWVETEPALKTADREVSK